MTKRRRIESAEHRSERLEKTVEERKERLSSEETTLDAAVRRSIAQFGA